MEHATLTAGLLKELAKNPVQVLVQVDQPLFDALQNEGVSPYLSVVIEYAYRLTRER